MPVERLNIKHLYCKHITSIKIANILPNCNITVNRVPLMAKVSAPVPPLPQAIFGNPRRYFNLEMGKLYFCMGLARTGESTLIRDIFIEFKSTFDTKIPGKR